MEMDNKLQEQVDTVVNPQTEHWRKGVGEILEFFGAGVDYDAIMNRAEEAFTKQQQLRMAIADANGEVDSYVRHAQRLAEELMEDEARKMQLEIAEIMNRDDLDASKKMELIRALQDEARRTQEIALSKARLIMSSQQGSALSLEQKRLLLRTLVERAKVAQANSEKTPTQE